MIDRTTLTRLLVGCFNITFLNFLVSGFLCRHPLETNKSLIASMRIKAGRQESGAAGGRNVGKVRTVLVKRLARELVDRYSQSFSVDFVKNKAVVDEVLVDTTKRLRNRIAGYVTHLMKLKVPREEPVT